MPRANIKGFIFFKFRMTFYKINQLAKEDNQKKTLNQGQIKRRNMRGFFLDRAFS